MKKIQLSKESLRVLTSQETARVAGASGRPECAINSQRPPCVPFSYAEGCQSATLPICPAPIVTTTN